MLIMVSPNGSDAVICIPESKIYNIKFEGKSVLLMYDVGGMIEINSQFVKQIESAKVTYDDDERVKKVIEQFYNAVKNRAAVFYFGNRKPKKNEGVESEIVEEKNAEVIEPEILEKKEGDENWLVKSLLS